MFWALALGCLLWQRASLLNVGFVISSWFEPNQFVWYQNFLFHFALYWLQHHSFSRNYSLHSWSLLNACLIFVTDVPVSHNFSCYCFSNYSWLMLATISLPNRCNAKVSLDTNISNSAVPYNNNSYYISFKSWRKIKEKGKKKCKCMRLSDLLCCVSSEPCTCACILPRENKGLFPPLFPVDSIQSFTSSRIWHYFLPTLYFLFRLTPSYANDATEENATTCR